MNVRTPVRVFFFCTICFLALLVTVIGLNRFPQKKSEKQEKTECRRHVIAVSVPPQKTLVDAVAGCDDFETFLMVGEGQDPHTFEPTPRQLMRLQKADLYFTIGLPFERVLVEKLQKLNPQLQFVSLQTETAHNHEQEIASKTESDPVSSPMESTSNHAHHHEEDPHCWMSPDFLVEAAHLISEVLSRCAPEQQESLTKREHVWCQQVREQQKRWVQELQQHDIQLMAVYHPAWGHFAEDFGIEQLAIERQGQAPSARHLSHFQERIRASKTRVLLVQNHTEAQRMASFVQSCGMQCVVINPLSPAILETLQATVDALCGRIPQTVLQTESHGGGQ